MSLNFYNNWTDLFRKGFFSREFTFLNLNLTSLIYEDDGKPIGYEYTVNIGILGFNFYWVIRR